MGEAGRTFTPEDLGEIKQDIMDWNKIIEAFNVVHAGIAKKIEGDQYVVYRCGSVIRLDVKMEG